MPTAVVVVGNQVPSGQGLQSHCTALGVSFGRTGRVGGPRQGGPSFPAGHQRPLLSSAAGLPNEVRVELTPAEYWWVLGVPASGLRVLSPAVR